MNFRWTAATMVCLLTLLVACGGGTDRTKAQVRLVNASTGYEKLELRIDDDLRQGDVAYGGNAGYVEANPGKPATITSPSSPTSLLSFTPSTSARKYYTVLAYGAAGSLKQVLLDDNNAEPNTNRAYLRVINAAPDAGALDVYLTNGGDDLAVSVPLQSAAAVDSVGSYIDVASGTWRVRITGADSKPDLRQDVVSVTLSSKQVATLVVVPGEGGVLVKTLLLVQQGGVTPQAATLARVRVASGLTNTEAKLGSTTLLPAGGAVALTKYVPYAAGPQTLVVNVAGTPLPSTVQTLAPGKDYTLLLYDDAGTPKVKPLEDDNRLPVDRAQAKVRLVNGLAGASGAVSLNIGLTPIGSAALGAASPYVTQASTTTARFTVSVVGVGTLVTSPTDQTFVAGSTYSVFVLGTNTPGSYLAELGKDR